MFTKEDIQQIESRGSSVETVEGQVERFRQGFPWMKIVAPATPARGILVLSDEEQDAAVKYYETAQIDGKCKFVPASGAASRLNSKGNSVMGMKALELLTTKTEESIF